ncbi:MAG: Sua5/YciO/YrdC/YwlC family protein [Planctomycetes bacterium]|jgi:tRNA A37 threonylcarbamoyladenosine synthetase subunit TsaC/SUA5/YrdC|nr:Sua5/YciO/YrdC/YwlC family protein [Planctomycetota bacterium]
MSALILDASRMDHAAELLRAGKLVAFPTDTVYGIASIPTHWADKEPADPRGVEIELGDDPDSVYLRRFKGGRKEPFSLHCGSVQSALRFVSPRAPLEEFAVSELGPRGVTVVLRWHRRGLGVRIVNHPVGSAFLEACAVPVLASSANLHGQPTLHDPRQIADLPGVDAVVDGGVLPPRPASTVARMLPCGLQVLRHGALGLADLGRHFTRDVHFVCVGNLNRSAFAHRLIESMQAWLAARVPDFVPAWRPSSSGVAGNPAVAVPEPMQQAASRRGVDLAAHRPSRFDPAVRGLRVALGDDVVQLVGDAALNLRVADPMGGPADGYERCAHEIVTRLHFQLLAQWAPVQDAALEDQFCKLFLAPGDSP